MAREVEDPATASRRQGPAWFAGAGSAQDVQGDESAGCQAAVDGDPHDTEPFFGGLVDPGCHTGLHLALDGLLASLLRTGLFIPFHASGEHQQRDQQDRLHAARLSITPGHDLHSLRNWQLMQVMPGCGWKRPSAIPATAVSIMRITRSFRLRSAGGEVTRMT